MNACIFDQLRAAPLRVQRLFTETAAPARQPVYTLPTVADWFNELADRCEKHIIWHADRARERRLQADDWEQQEGMLSALADILDAPTDDAFEAAHDALTLWKYIADGDATTREPMHHAIELDQGEIGSLLRGMEALAYLGKAERDGAMDPLRIAHEVAAVGFAAPGYPQPEEG